MSPGVLQGEVATAGGSGGGAEGLLVGPDGNLRFADWLFRSKAASVIWLVARLWLGYGGGVGVKGFAGAGVAGSATGKGGASYGWFAAFLHNFVIPNASWIAKLVTVSEVVIGILLLVGLFTGAAAFCGIGLNVIYMFSGSAGVNPAYALVSVFLILAWRNAGYIGLDRLALPAVSGWLHSHGGKRHGATRTPKVVLPAH